MIYWHVENYAISIHAFRVEGDMLYGAIIGDIADFNPRLPCGRRQQTGLSQSQLAKNFNPRLPCGRRLQFDNAENRSSNISIHAFRVEGDNSDIKEIKVQSISIHAFRVEGDSLTAFKVPSPKPISIHAFRVEGDPRRCDLGWV